MKVSSSILYCFSLTTLAAAQWNNLQCSQIGRAKRIVLESLKTLPASCEYTIEAFSSHTCQLLVQFEKFLLHQPILRNGVLECGDRLSVGDFTLCGSNAQQHLYIPLQTSAYSGTKARISFKFDLSSRWPQTQWRIVITQLECPYAIDTLRLSSIPLLGFMQNLENVTRTLFPPPYFGDFELLAPTGCDQYYTKSSGIIRSFNFNYTNGSLYLPNMSYVICFKGIENVQNIDYAVEKFSMSVEDIKQAGFDFDCYNTIDTPGRRSDYLMIPQAKLPNLPILRPTYFCGRSLESHQVIASLPFIIYFESDNLADPTETGFVINYRIK